LTIVHVHIHAFYDLSAARLGSNYICMGWNSAVLDTVLGQEGHCTRSMTRTLGVAGGMLRGQAPSAYTVWSVCCRLWNTCDGTFACSTRTVLIHVKRSERGACDEEDVSLHTSFHMDNAFPSPRILFVGACTLARVLVVLCLHSIARQPIIASLTPSLS
jgi:hypothetical protein